MISDYSLLGISEGASISEIKKAYRLKIKQLHPDVSDDTDSVKNHFLFVEVCKAYERLCEKTTDSGISKEKNDAISNELGNGLVKHKDAAYVYYKKAYACFELIHPSHWNSTPTITINGKTEEENQLQEQTVAKVRELVHLFPKAYYYFSVVVHEYSDSVWVDDAKEKMLIIEKRMQRYKKILESFSTWNKETPLIKSGK